MCRYIFRISFIVVVFSFICNPCFSAELLVPGGYATIQDAIDAAAYNGDTITLAAGTYTGTGNRDLVFNGKTVTIRSTDPNSPAVVAATVIDCQGSSSDKHRVLMFQNEYEDCTISGLTIVNGYAPYNPFTESDSGGAIVCYQASPLIEKCVFTNNYGGLNGGGISNYYGTITVIDCEFRNNSASIGAGIWNHTGRFTIQGCVFENNTAVSDGAAIKNYGCLSGTSISDCNFLSNSASYYGAVSNDNSDTTISNCHFQNNTASSSSGGAVGNAGSAVTMENCTFEDNTVGSSFASYGGAIYNSTSANDDQIIITDCDFFNNQVIGNGSGGAVYQTGGILVMERCGIENSVPEGIHLSSNSTSASFTDCDFLNNAAEGLVSVCDTDIDGCSFISNQDSGTQLWWGYHTVSNSIFRDNTADRGGGIYLIEGRSTITNCQFVNNDANSSSYGGGGIHFKGGSFEEHFIVNCAFLGNRATSPTSRGGGVYSLSSVMPVFVNCLFSGNSCAGYGGGGVCNRSSSDSSFINCTFSGNTTTGQGGAIFNDNSTIVLTNSILWGNTSTSGYQIYPYWYYADIEYCNLQSNWTGSGSNNISADPLFEDPDGADNIYGTEDDNLRLGTNSPCIDAADNTAIPFDETDIDGDGDVNERIPFDLIGIERFIDEHLIADTGVADPPDYTNVVDMGCYEYAPIIFVDAAAAGNNDGSSWLDAYVYLQDALADANFGDQIRVAEGIYYPDHNTSNPSGSGDAAVSFDLKDGIAVYGGFPTGGGFWADRDISDNPAILSGNIGSQATSADNSYHVVTAVNNSRKTVINGFVIQDGYAYGMLAGGAYGGGMYSIASDSTIVVGCTFINNTAYTLGGGFYTDCNSTLINCRLINNLTQMSGGGLYNANGDTALINCEFILNQATSSGGAVFNNNISLSLLGCSLYANQAQNGGGVYNAGGDAIVANSILWSNTPEQLVEDFSGSIIVEYSDIQGGWAGAGNISVDPMFLDPDGPDDTLGTFDDTLKLALWSSCIDAGDNSIVAADIVDMDGDNNITEPIPVDILGNDRFTDDPLIIDTGNSATGYPKVVEMGAYERDEWCGDDNHQYPTMDFNHDCVVDLVDLAQFCSHWLENTLPD